ncbi:MAG: amidohydrolase family protein, partial [Limisphaerales bacterium]
VIFEPESALMNDRAARVAAEFNLDFALVSCGQEWRRPDLAKATKAQFIVPLNFPELPKLPDTNDWNQVTLDQLRAWDWAPENAALLRQQGLEITLTTYGLADKKNFRKNLKTALERGLSETDALAALTTVPAKLCGMENFLGTIEAGKLANLTVVAGTNYFDPETKMRAVWIEGNYYHAQSEETKNPKVEEKKPTEIKTPEEGDPKKPALENEKELAKNPKEEKPKDELSKKEKEKKEAEKRELLKKRVAHSPLEGRGVITNAQNLLIRNATIWTSSTNGILTNASILIYAGKIQSIGIFKADSTTKSFKIDANGMHVTPGLIDCHSHAAILGDVNEGTVPSSAMVRIGDVVNSETENLYYELAGGLTVANLLHGSANPIGGQNQVIKLRDGASPEELKFEGAIPGIKFALGENVKQSNWGEKYVTRFPQTRMGVRTFIQNRFIAAQQYLKAWEKFNKASGLPPQKDLELEAIGEILHGQRLIHCHSYRQDEILMM